MSYRSALNRVSLILLLIGAGLLITGVDACQDDYCVGCEASVPTPTLTFTITPTPEDDEDPDATPTLTSTPTVTGSISPTLTVTPTITGTVGTTKLSRNVSADGRTLLQGIPTGSVSGDLTWLGNQKKPFVDSDGDGFSDDVELAKKTDPKNEKSNPQLRTSLNRAELVDEDGDELTASEETEFGTDPKKADTDGDSLSDYLERAMGTDPLLIDSDSDGVTDGAEVQRGADPLKADW